MDSLLRKTSVRQLVLRPRREERYRYVNLLGFRGVLDKWWRPVWQSRVTSMTQLNQNMQASKISTVVTKENINFLDNLDAYIILNNAIICYQT
jgi:hypothetical protein